MIAAANPNTSATIARRRYRQVLISLLAMTCPPERGLSIEEDVPRREIPQRVTARRVGLRAVPSESDQAADADGEHRDDDDRQRGEAHRVGVRQHLSQRGRILAGRLVGRRLGRPGRRWWTVVVAR